MSKLDELKYKISDQSDRQWDGHEGRVWRTISRLLFVISLLLLSTVWYYSYKYTVGRLSDQEIPVVHKNESMLRNKPLDPGGVIFSNQDKEIYRSLGQEKRGVDAVDGSVVDTVNKVKEQAAQITQVLDSLDDKHEEMGPPMPPVQETQPATNKLVEQVTPRQKQEVAKQPKDIFQAIGGEAKQVKLRVAVLESADDGAKEFSRIKGRYMDDIKKAQYELAEYKTNNGKILYKLLVTGISEGEAKKLCERMKLSKSNCIIIK